MKSPKKDLREMSKQLKALAKKMERLMKAVDKLEKAQVAKKPKPKVKARKQAPARKAAAKKRVYRKTPAREATASTATDQVLKIIKKTKKGVDASTLIQKTGFADKKVRNILMRASSQGKIKRASRGIYVAA